MTRYEHGQSWAREAYQAWIRSKKSHIESVEMLQMVFNSIRCDEDDEFEKAVVDYIEFLNGKKSTFEERRQIYKLATDKFGERAQLIVALEELSELSNEIAKYLNSKNKRGIDGLIDEITDVSIMIEQLVEIFNIRKNVSDSMDRKLKELHNRMS